MDTVGESTLDVVNGRLTDSECMSGRFSMAGWLQCSR
jgi:hypothetical protein